MITILVKASNQNNLRDLLRSLINNAESRDNYHIFVTGDPDKDKEWIETISEFTERADIVLLKSINQLGERETDLIWILKDEVFVLGHQWDKRLEFYKNKFQDGIVVMFPTGYKPYGAKAEAEIEVIAERHPVLSAKWVELIGLDHAEMICRMLFIKHGIDRRIDLRLLDLQTRAGLSPNPPYDARVIEKKASIIADYIKDFTPSVT